MPMSIDSFRSYDIAEVGVNSAHTELLRPLFQLAFVARPESQDATTKPEFLVITVGDVRIDQGVALRRYEPLVLQASLCDPDDCYRAEVPGLEMPIAAYGRGELIDALCDLIAVSWKEYALEDDAKLTARGKRLKARLLRDYREVE